MTQAPSKLRKRLWLAGGGVALFLFTVVIAGPLLDKSPGTGKLWLGHDFLPAYLAGQFARTGEFRKMYDRNAFRAAQDRVVDEAGLELDKRYAAALNPPHFALLFAPLSVLPYRTAAAAWLGVNGILFAASLVLLVRMLPPESRPHWKTWGLVPLLATVSMPFLQAAGHQQNTFLSLLILTATVTLWRAGRGFAAGAVAGLLFYKPQLAAVVALVLAIDLGRRALLGLGVTGTFLLLLTLVAMPGALPEYFGALPSNLDFIQNQPHYPWHRQATILGFVRFLLQGDTPGTTSSLTRTLWLTFVTFGTVALAAVVFRTRATRRPGAASPESRDRVIAATVAATPLLLPYYLDYDLLLLAVPAVLFAGEALTTPDWTKCDHWTSRAWVALCVWMYANPGASGMMRVGLTAPLLAAVTAGLLTRAWRLSDVEPAGLAEPEQPVAARDAERPATLAA